MRIILKIIAAPFVLALILIVAGAYVPVLRGGGGVHCGLCGSVPAGDPLPAGWADSRLHRHVCAGVPRFPLWAPGPGAAG